ncbi:MAG: hypothetical protein ABFQ62_00715 [Patescibacteria group bacterium]
MNNQISTTPAPIPAATQIPQMQTKQEISNPQEISYLEKAEEIFVNPTARRLIAIGLTIQGLMGLFNSLKFVMVDFPILEARLLQHSITQSEVNSIAVQAILMTGSTILSMFFALKITLIQNKAAKALNTIIAVFLLFGNAFIFNTLNDLPLIELWSKFIDDILLIKNKIF